MLIFLNGSKSASGPNYGRAGSWDRTCSSIHDFHGVVCFLNWFCNHFSIDQLFPSKHLMCFQTWFGRYVLSTYISSGPVIQVFRLRNNFAPYIHLTYKWLVFLNGGKIEGGQKLNVPSSYDWTFSVSFHKLKFLVLFEFQNFQLCYWTNWNWTCSSELWAYGFLELTQSLDGRFV